MNSSELPIIEKELKESTSREAKKLRIRAQRAKETEEIISSIQMRKGAFKPPVSSSQDVRPEKPREAITLSESPENTYVQNTMSQRRDSEKPPQASDYGLDLPKDALGLEKRGEKKRVRSSATI